MNIFKVGKHKRASLDLSLNAIVILVLAIAILGLGLTFIRGIFKSITGKVEEAVSIGDLTNPPTRDNPITVTPTSVTVRQGETAQVKVAFMNIQSDTRSMMLQLAENNVGDCVTYICNTNPVYSDDALTMQKDQINLWTIALAPGATSTAGTYLYTAKMCKALGTICDTTNPEEYSRDFVVTIRP